MNSRDSSISSNERLKCYSNKVTLQLNLKSQNFVSNVCQIWEELWSRFSGRKRRKSCLLKWKKNIFPIFTRMASMVHLKCGSEWNFEWRRRKDEEMQLNLRSSKEFAWVGLWFTFECLSAGNYFFVFGSASTCSETREIYWSAGSQH